METRSHINFNIELSKSRLCVISNFLLIFQAIVTFLIYCMYVSRINIKKKNFLKRKRRKLIDKTSFLGKLEERM